MSWTGTIDLRDPGADPSVPATALERYRVLAEHPPVEKLRRTDWRTMPSQVKRYAPGGRVGAGHLLGDVLRDTHGFTRYQWNDLRPMPGQLGTAARSPGRALRPSPSGGGMASAELYVLCGPPAPARLGADPGAYHYDPAAHALDLVRRDGVPAHAGGQGSAATVVVASVAARLAFKYGEFAFRLQCLDAGAVVGQLLAVLAAHGLAARVRTRFDENEVHRLLGLDPAGEVVLAMVDIEPAPGPPAAVPPAGHPALPTAATRPAPALTELPITRALREASGAQVEEGPLPAAEGGERAPASLSPPRPSPGRRSADGRLCGALSTDRFAAVCDAAGFGVDSEEIGARQVRVHAITRNVPGLGGLPEGRGVFRYDSGPRRLELLASTDVGVRGRPGESGGYAAALYLVGEFAPTSEGVQVLGDRWYQVQLLAAGIVAQRAALGAAAAGVGARIQCAYDTDAAVASLGLSGWQRPVCQVVLGPDDSRLSYQQDIVH
ncbi:SagB/ThcOx family dehydrogenase [Actinomycetes bacterium KLBMP 9759]